MHQLIALAGVISPGLSFLMVARSAAAQSHRGGLAAALGMGLGGVFFLPHGFSVAFAAALLCAVFVVEAGWYAIVAPALSSPLPRAAYLRTKVGIDRAAGTVMIGLGVRLVASARAA